MEGEEEMIKLKLKDNKLRKSSRVRKWIHDVEAILRKEFPPDELDLMYEDIALYGSHMRDENNVRIPPEKWPDDTCYGRNK